MLFVKQGFGVPIEFRHGCCRVSIGFRLGCSLVSIRFSGVSAFGATALKP